MSRVVVVGGAGDMAAVAVRRLRELRGQLAVVLADRDVEKANRRAVALGPGASAEPVDLFDPRRLRELVRGARLVVNATGPYFRTGGPVLEAAIDERVDYIDFGDDVEAADLMLGFDRPARDAGVTALIGAGVSPGLVNVVVRLLAERLDVPEAVQVAWVTGSSPGRPGEEPGGRAVLEHMLHECTGVTFTVEGGRRRTIPAFRRSTVVTFPEPLGPVRVYDLGHAELATIPRFIPTVQRVRALGGLHPPALNGFFQGLGRAVSTGAVPWDDAVELLVGLQAGANPRLRPTLAAFAGIGRQAIRGELGRAGLRDLPALLRGDVPAEHLGGLSVRVDGERDGRPAGWLARSALRQTTDAGGMDDVTGTPLAAMAHLLLDGRVAGPGVVAPEAAVDPADLRPLLERFGTAGTEEMFRPLSLGPGT